MADALLSIPLQIAVEKLAEVIAEQIGLFSDAADDLREIRCKFQSVQAVLMDAERKQVSDESVRVWLSKLKGVALDIEDVVEEAQISSAGSDDDDEEGKVRSTCLPITPAYFKSYVVSRYKVGVLVKEIRKRLDEIRGDRLMSSFSSSSSVGGESDTIRVSRDWRKTSSLVEESDIIGRDEDKKTVISWLVSDAEDGPQEEEVHVTAIIGVGGLGKTTLAQQIFNDPKVKDHFNQDLYWVCVSDVFDVIKLTKAIIVAADNDAGGYPSSELNVLQNKLLDSLKGKRYLLVLDDVWNEDDEKWKMLRLSLKSGAQGSRILVTTRSEKVAKIMNSACIHKLGGLSDDLSWKLFSSRAFPGKNPKEFSNFESIGIKIASKCKGVPLSIKVMGSTMNTKTTIADWQNILESEMWSLPEVKGGILPSLQLSYYHLPPHLKQCFSCCSIYQKDEVMIKSELVNLWMAQGFIRPEGNREMEDIGEEYFNGLVARSMFQEVCEHDPGYTTCKMHDLLHDLATVIMQDESYIFTASKKPNPQYSSISDLRHASLFLSEGNANISIASCQAKKLRTLFVNNLYEIRGVHDKLFGDARFLRALLFRSCVRMKVPPKAIEKLKHLRYLNLSGSSIVELPPKTIEKLKQLRYLDLSRSKVEKLPEAFGKMKHLRYLNLSKTEIEEFPESVSHLVNLHTLNLNDCKRLKSLCRGIFKIVGLRHLYIEKTYGLNGLPKGIGKLIFLQSLSKFIVGRDEGECGIEELQELNSLQGRLEIKGLDRVSEAEQATRVQLCKLYLQTLILDISSDERDVEDDKKEERIKVLECLRPHPNLQHLSLKGYSISKLRLPSWIEDPSFSNLIRLEIAGFRKWEPNNTMPGLGKLPGLKCLEIREVGVRKLGDEFYYGIGMSTSNDDGVGERRGVAFPKLENLLLWGLDELEEWELTGEADASKVMPFLRELEITFCPKLQLLPSHLAIATTRPQPTSSSSEVLEESENCNELKSLTPDHWLKPLEVLAIYSCQKLQLLPHWLGQLKKLQLLEIRGAKELACLPDSLGQLKSLEKLEIGDFESLPQSLGGLNKLRSLTLSSLKKLESLPDSLGQLASLEYLRIQECSQLKSLPQSLGRLQKLKRLQVENCEELESLPDSLKELSLPQGLWIYGCPQLPYQREGRRDDWPSISHIKSIYINGKSF